MESAQKFLLHYYLNDNSHSMDALVRNKCETELLAMLQEIAAVFEIDVQVECEALREGGLKDIWRFIGTYSNQLAFLIAVLTLVLSRIPASDSEQDALTKEQTKLTIEEKKLQIEKLKRELKEGESKLDSAVSASEALLEDAKISTRKSNFYKALIVYTKVTGIGMAPLDNENHLLTNERFVSQEHFPKFLITTNQLAIETIEGAEIEIISPVLKEGNYKWRGTFQGVPISFSMTDAEFKNEVLREAISFKHGSVINCVLHVHRKLDEAGNITVTGYSVATVIKKIDGASILETPQGKRYKTQKTLPSNQGNLFNEILIERDDF